jgi:hypothetical protein
VGAPGELEVEAVAFGFTVVFGVAAVIGLEANFVGGGLTPDGEAGGERARGREAKAEFVTIILGRVEGLGRVGGGARAELERATVAGVELGGGVRLERRAELGLPDRAVVEDGRAGVVREVEQLAVEPIGAKRTVDADPRGGPELGANERAGVFERVVVIARGGGARARDSGEALVVGVLLVELGASVDRERQAGRRWTPLRGEGGAGVDFVFEALLLGAGRGEAHEAVALHVVAIDFRGAGQAVGELGVAVQGELEIFGRAAVGRGKRRGGARCVAGVGEAEVAGRVAVEVMVTGVESEAPAVAGAGERPLAGEGVFLDPGVVAVTVAVTVAGEISLCERAVFVARERLRLLQAEVAGHEFELLPGERLERVHADGAGDGVEPVARIGGALDDLDALDLEREDGTEVVVAAVEVGGQAVDEQAQVRAGTLAVETAQRHIGGDDALIEVGERDAGDFAEELERVVGAFVFELVSANDGDGGEQVGGLRAEFGRGDLVATEGDVGPVGCGGGKGLRRQRRTEKGDEKREKFVGMHGESECERVNAQRREKRGCAGENAAPNGRARVQRNLLRLPAVPAAADAENAAAPARAARTRDS